MEGRLVDIGGTRLYVVERGGPDGLPLIVLHGGPGLDHHAFGDYLDPLGDRLRLLLVDQRGQGRSDPDVPADSLTLEEMADDVSRLAAALGLTSYAVLGHSFGAMVALQHACDAPGAAAGTVISSGVPSARWLKAVEQALQAFEPVELRQRVAASWARESEVDTPEEFAELMHEQLPFHFADPYDPRIAEYEQRTAGTVYAPRVLRLLAANGYGGLDAEGRLGAVSQPLLALAGRHDRTCPPEAAEAIAAGVQDGRCHVFERSGHMTYVEERDAYLNVVGEFLAALD